MSQIQIKNIEHSEKTSKAGNQYTSCKITVWNKKENKDTFLSGFGDAITKSWSPGDTVDVSLSQNEKGYWNFILNQESKPCEKPEVKLLRAILSELQMMNGKKVETIATELGLTSPTTETEPQPPTVQPGDPNEIKVEEIPF